MSRLSLTDPMSRYSISHRVRTAEAKVRRAMLDQNSELLQEALTELHYWTERKKAKQ